MNIYLILISLFLLQINTTVAFCCGPRFNRKKNSVVNMRTEQAFSPTHWDDIQNREKPIAGSSYLVSTDEVSTQSEAAYKKSDRLLQKNPQIALHRLLDEKSYGQALEYLKANNQRINLTQVDKMTGLSYLGRLAEDRNKLISMETNERQQTQLEALQALRLTLQSYVLFHAIDQAIYTNVLRIIQEIGDPNSLRHVERDIAPLAYCRQLLQKESTVQDVSIPGLIGTVQDDRASRLARICAALENPLGATRCLKLLPPEIIVTEGEERDFRTARNVFEEADRGYIRKSRTLHPR